MSAPGKRIGSMASVEGIGAGLRYRRRGRVDRQLGRPAVTPAVTPARIAKARAACSAVLEELTPRERAEVLAALHLACGARRPLSLADHVFDLVARAGRPVGRHELLAIFGAKPNTLDVAIIRLRRDELVERADTGYVLGRRGRELVSSLREAS